jgi:membrane protein YqaA with SNARE-associated domain
LLNLFYSKQIGWMVYPSTYAHIYLIAFVSALNLFCFRSEYAIYYLCI